MIEYIKRLFEKKTSIEEIFSLLKSNRITPEVLSKTDNSRINQNILYIQKLYHYPIAIKNITTPLDYAIMNDKVTIDQLKLLLKHGANKIKLGEKRNSIKINKAKSVSLYRNVWASHSDIYKFDIKKDHKIDEKQVENNLRLIDEIDHRPTKYMSPTQESKLELVKAQALLKIAIACGDYKKILEYVINIELSHQIDEILPKKDYCNLNKIFSEEGHYKPDGSTFSDVVKSNEILKSEVMSKCILGIVSDYSTGVPLCTK